MFKSIYKFFIWVLMSFFLFTGLSNAQVSGLSMTNNSVKVVLPVYPIFTLSPMAGGIFPVSEFGNTYQAGFSGALDAAMRLNKELGIFANLGYYSVTNINELAPNSNYYEITAGPRYYFTKSNLKSTFFLETGVGAYIFSQDAYNNNVGQTHTNVGLSVGPGFTMQASKSVDLILKTKYQMIFMDGGTRSFITGLGGIEFKF